MATAEIVILLLPPRQARGIASASWDAVKLRDERFILRHMKNISRRGPLESLPAALAVAPLSRANARKPVVAAHPWVYAATQPNYDIYPILAGILPT
jgi:hypothetical protein